MKKWLTILIVTLIVGSFNTGTIFASSIPVTSQSFRDMGNHWAADTVNKWSKRGVIQGISNEHFEPGRGITRAEWVTLLNRAFQLQTQSNVSFSDVPNDSWYKEEVNKAVSQGYMKGYEDNTFRPSALLTREQAALSIAKLLDILDINDTSSKLTFKDTNQIGSWSIQAVQAIVSNQILNGYKDGTFAPQKLLTRAEAVTLLDRAVAYSGAWYGEAGTYGPSTGIQQQKGNVIIDTPDVTLQNTEIAGNLIIGEHVGEGDITLKNVKVNGETYVYGGGEHSIHLDDSVLISVIVDKKEGTVRLVAEGKTTVNEVKIKTGAALDVSEGASIDRVTLTNQMPEDSTVSLRGYFQTVNVEAFNIKVSLPAGKVDKMNVSENATGTTIDTSKEASILSLILNATANVIGLGSIEKATINAENISFITKPKEIIIGSQIPTNTKIKVDGKDENINETGNRATSSTNGGGSSKGSNSSGSNNIGSNNNEAGNSGSNNSGSNSSNNDKKDDSVQPQNPSNSPLKINVPRTIVAVGDDVYFTSNHNGTAYFASNYIVMESKEALQLALESGEAMKLDVRANETVSFSTYNIRNWSYPSNFEFNLQVQDGQGNTAEEEILVLDENSDLDQSPIFSHDLAQKGEKDAFSFDYNRLLYLVEGKSVYNIIEWSIDNGGFVPFTEQDGIVEIKNNTVRIIPNQLKAKQRYAFRLKAHSVQTNDRQLNESYMYDDMRKTVYTTMIAPSNKPYQVKRGDTITFQLTDSSTVYLVNTFVTGSESTFDDLVAEHWATKTIVDKEHIDVPVTISTEDLPIGNYELSVWDGIDTSIEIIE